MRRDGNWIAVSLEGRGSRGGCFEEISYRSFENFNKSKTREKEQKRNASLFIFYQNISFNL